MSSKRTPRNKLRAFKIIRIGRKGEHVTTVLAKDADKAINEHCQDRGLSGHERKRLMAILDTAP